MVSVNRAAHRSAMESTINFDSILQFPDPQSDDDMYFMSSFGTPVTQVPTPPTEFSEDFSDTPDEDVVAKHFWISTTFSARANWHTLPPDLVFATSDMVLFYVHAHIILSSSDNHFHSLIPLPSIEQSSDSVIHVPENSQTFNIIIHLIYNLPSSQFSPSFETLSLAVLRLSFYGISPKAYVTVRTPLHALILTFAPIFPMEVYTLAAKHDLLDLAIPTSPHLLAFDLSTLTEQMAVEMGPVYLRKLFFLHIRRCDALKKFLLRLPRAHPPTEECNFENQRGLGRVWALASAHLAWLVRPGFLESCLNPLTDTLACDECKDGLRICIKNLLVGWSQVKNTI
ncbi:hypothetical protein D9757_005087 [Collybiopsis confluens]|uniref:BTB domain-containing protein n=1 Tax=Collybiopsis confluens TaxID=2823264 RepID=A0A8H5MC24_9AGAR|nr:hypothetical protein D9757_005087 [Collybiopsis confluens]